VIREKVTISPERRKLLRLVGVFGKEEKQLKEESELNDFFFRERRKSQRNYTIG